MQGVTLKHNEEYHGIELYFDKKPSEATIANLKEQGFRWHRTKKCWYAKETETRSDFANKLCDIKEPKKATKPINKKEKTDKLNTFAASYDKIGNAEIIPNGDVGLIGHIEVFCEEEQIYFRRFYGCESITIEDLTNAQATGKTCDIWSIYPGPGINKEDLFSLLSNAGINSITDLVKSCRAGESIDGVTISCHQMKGVYIFSPFVEVKPLKELPEKWTKRNFTQALMSGQLFRGEVAYHYTDDYAMDAAYSFGTGREIDMVSFAKNEVGDWDSCTSCYSDKSSKDKNGIYIVHYSPYSNSGKTLYFDVNCDIAQGKKRAKEHAEALANYNNMMKASCITVKPEDINPCKIYTVSELDMDINTGVYCIKESNLQGFVLQERLNPEDSLMDVLSFKEIELQPDQFYSIANFYHRMSNLETDDSRLVAMGNWEHIVSGKALLEMTAEEKYMPDIRLDSKDKFISYEAALENLTNHANGTMKWLTGVCDVDYKASIKKLTNEYIRAGGKVNSDLAHGEPKQNRVSLDELIGFAQKREATQKSGPSEKDIQYSDPIR